MTAESLPIHAESLLQHREFVRALARKLVRDEHTSQDVIQETWLEALRHPPRSLASARGWLGSIVRSRAQNVARGEARRTARERATARPEADGSEVELRERVAMQHKVVESVLALKEPYRAVVLLHYYEGLSPSAIASRRGVSAGTVSSQLNRAHELLRERLDAEFGGKREAWSIAVFALARRGPAAAMGAKVALIGGLLAAAIAAPIVWPRVASHASGPTATGPAIAARETPASLQSEALDPNSSSNTGVSARVPLAQGVATLESQSSQPDLDALSIEEALQLARHVQRALQTRLLVPDRDAPEVSAVLTRHPDTALARILPYGRLDGDIDGRFLGIRGAGAFFSFFTRSNDYGQQPDIHLDQELSSGSYGGTAGFLVDAGSVELAALPVLATSSPLAAMTGGREKWDLLWTDAHMTVRDFDRSLVERANELQLTNHAPARVGNTYIVRSILPGEHDLLAAFQLLSRDDYGYTFAWRLLHAWPLPEGASRTSDGAVIDRVRGFTPPGVPAWVSQLDVPALMELSHGIRAAADPKLFPKRQDLERTYAAILGSPDAGLARMLHRSAFDPIIDGRERGAFYSFATLSKEFGREQDLMYDQNRFCSAATKGIFLDLGPVDLDSLVRSGESAPPRLNAQRSEAWSLLWTLRHADNVSASERGRALLPEDEQRVEAAAFDRTVPAILHHTYVLRTIEPEKHDLLVAFTVVDMDDYGLWLVWKKLRSW